MCGTGIKPFAAGIMAAFLIIAGMVTGPARAADTLRGMALVVGNGDYEHLPDLANPGNDARAIEILLNDLGFETELSADRTFRRLRRDIDNFTEDAVGADVALLYYSGHGIEAGGENWLVPVDAHLASPEDAGKSLVSLSSIVAELQQSVSVVIVLLDACRDNPFPKGSTLSSDGISEPVVISASGLGETRGVRVLAAEGASAGNLGTVIGFAAEPGRVAFDGQGANSPYAAAILKHMATLAGEEFGTVMRMVAEEVYLNTAGRQRPWINENLRRLLFFGDTAPESVAEESEISSERRQLLLTISTLDEHKRRAMETIASTDNIPLDAVFAMLKALGADAPDDPLQLEQVMRKQTERVKTILAERETLSSPNPEIRRLGELADRAIDEGAFKAATLYLDHAKKLMEDSEEALLRAETDIKSRRLENAAVYARSADAHVLAFNNLAAAEDYGRAFEQVKRWDAVQAWEYKTYEASSLVLHGIRKGDLAAMNNALKATDAAQLAIAGSARPNLVTQSRIYRAIQLSTLGHMTGNGDMLEEAADVLRALSDSQAAVLEPSDLTTLRLTQANTYRYLGDVRDDRDAFKRAIAIFKDVLADIDRSAAPIDWARTAYNLGAARAEYGDRFDDVAEAEMAVNDYEQVLKIYTFETAPLDWVRSKVNLGMALAIIGDNRQDRPVLKRAEMILMEGLEQADRRTIPIVWARAHDALGRVYAKLGDLKGNPELVTQAVRVSRLALEEFSKDNTPTAWASAQSRLGTALLALAGRENSDRLYSQAVEAIRKSLEISTRESAPDMWATRQRNLGIAFYLSGAHRRDVSALRQAQAAFEDVLLVRTRTSDPAIWATVMVDLGIVRGELGQLAGDIRQIEKAIDELRAALELLPPESHRVQVFRGQRFLAKALAARFAETLDYTQLEASIAAYRNAVAIGEDVSNRQSWLETNVDLGKGLMLLGQKAGDYSYFEAAIPVFKEAARSGVGLIDVENNNSAYYGLGLANYFIGKKNNDAGHLQAAVDAFETALEYQGRSDAPKRWAKIKRFLGDCHGALAGRQNEPNPLSRAISSYREALNVYSLETSRADWIKAQSGLGIALQRLGERTDDPALLVRSAQSFASILEAIDCDTAPAQCAPITHNLAVALKGRGERIGNIAVLEEALSASRRSWRQYQQAGFSQYEDYFDKQMRAIESRIMQLE